MSHGFPTVSFGITCMSLRIYCFMQGPERKERKHLPSQLYLQDGQQENATNMHGPTVVPVVEVCVGGWGVGGDDVIL